MKQNQFPVTLSVTLESKQVQPWFDFPFSLLRNSLDFRPLSNHWWVVFDLLSDNTYPLSSITPCSCSLPKIWVFLECPSSSPFKVSWSCLSFLNCYRKKCLSSFRASSSCLTSSISSLERFFFDDALSMNAAFPLEAILDWEVSKLTAKALTLLQCRGKLRSHVHNLILADFKLLPSILHCLCNHCLNSHLVMSVQHIANPFLIKVIPVLLIRNELE